MSFFQGTLMIHNVHLGIFELDLCRYRLTFDDGLYSQYYYMDLFDKMETEMILFPATGFIREGPRRKTFDGKTPLPFVRARDYMHEAFLNRNFQAFMTVSEVQFLAEKAKIKFGAHSHFHDIVLTNHPPKKKISRWKREYLPAPFHPNGTMEMNRRSRLAFRGFRLVDGGIVPRTEKEWREHIKKDTEKCLEWFDTYLNFLPTDYCFPFNEYTPALIEILKGYGFTRFFNGRSSEKNQVIGRIDFDKLSTPESR